jgi:hypothetical protein
MELPTNPISSNVPTIAPPIIDADKKELPCAAFYLLFHHIFISSCTGVPVVGDIFGLCMQMIRDQYYVPVRYPIVAEDTRGSLTSKERK